MTRFSDDILAEYVLGTLDEPTRLEVARLAAESAELRQTIHEIEALLCVPAAALEPVAPSAAVRDRLLASIATENRFARFADRVGQLLDLGRQKAQALLAAIDEATSWEPGFAEGISLYHLDGGPAVANAVVGFVKIAAGTGFPHHEHIGEEIVYVLQGACRDDVDGQIGRPGDEIRKPAGSEHAFSTLPGADFIYLAVVYDGVKIGDMVMGPDSPDF